MYDERLIRARDWALPLIAGATLLTWAFTRPSASTVVWLVMAIGGGFGLWFLFNLVEWMADRIGYQVRANRELEYKFSPNFKLETVARMNADQIKAVRAGMQIIEILPGDRGPVEKVGGTECYRYTAWWILINSTSEHVYPINRFMTGTFHFDVLGDMAVSDQQQAKNFHHWLYVNGYAMWGRGNTSMSWNAGWDAERVMKTLGLERDTYEEPAE